MAEPTTIADLVRSLRAAFAAGRTRPLAWRKAQLAALERMMRDEEPRILEALHKDMRKPAIEAWSADINYVTQEARHALAHLEEWTAEEPVRTNLINMPGASKVVREPLGVVLIIGAWNYPVNLVLAPLVGALAAGNAAVIKPSEVTPETSKLLGEIVPKYLDPAAVRVVEGGVEETTALLQERFDHIFYTGNGTVGRIVMAAASKHLTPVTLELGGKCPVYVDESADLDVAVRRVLWGKFFNAGQTCLAPDYVLVHEAVEAAFVERAKEKVRAFFGDDPQKSTSFTRIVNERHWDRLMKLLEDSPGEVIAGGTGDRADRYVAPTLLRGVRPDARIMQEEIFGPLLPILKVKDAEEAIAFITAREKPLALYVFARKGRVADRVLEGTSSGGACVNEVVAHFAVTDLPFGGVGASGFGNYHGRATFEAFSHRKAVLTKLNVGEPPVRYAPYTEASEKWMRRLLEL